MHNTDQAQNEEFPFSYIQSAIQILLEKNGNSKLRARNDMIHGDLIDLARRRGAKVEFRKHGDRTWFIIPSMGITVCLVNS